MRDKISIGTPYHHEGDHAFYARLDCRRHPQTVRLMTDREAVAFDRRADEIIRHRQLRAIEQHEALHKAERARWRKSRRSALR
jgi:hypothetical protein